MKRILLVINKHNLIPDHQFGFRRKHYTIEQSILYSKETVLYTAVFIDVRQSMATRSPLLHLLAIYKILFFYLTGSYFFVKVNQEITNIGEISSGASQGSVLCPILYTILTAALPLSICISFWAVHQSCQSCPQNKLLI